MENLEKKAKKQHSELGTALDLLFVPTSSIQAIRMLKQVKGPDYLFAYWVPPVAGELARAALYGYLISSVI